MERITIMASNDETVRVVYIGEPGATQQQIMTAFNTQAEFELVDVLSVRDRLAREIRAIEPHLLLVDHSLEGRPTLDLLDDLALQIPDLAIIAILPHDDAVLVQQVMLAGARAFLIQPFTQVNLITTLKRVKELETRRQQSKVIATSRSNGSASPIRSIAVFSPRGGTGVSTVASNLAIAMQIQTGRQVLLMEGKQFFGHLDVLLNIRSRNTIADLLPHASTMDEALVHDVVIPHVSGIHVLLGPGDLQISQGIRPDDLYNVFIGLQKIYPFIVIDAGSHLSENTVTLLDASDKILLVTNPDLAALHDASRFIQITKSLAYPADKTLIILNRDDLAGGIRTNDVEGALHNQLFAHIPDDSANALRSLNRGIPIIMKYGRSPMSKALVALGKSLMTMKIANQVNVVSGNTNASQREALLASSRLG
jgi:pilus assembly protein CpaE